MTPTGRDILTALLDGPRRAPELAATLRKDVPMIHPQLSALRRLGYITSTHLHEHDGVQRRRVAEYAITTAGREALAVPVPEPPTRDPAVLRRLADAGGVTAVARHLGMERSSAASVLRECGIRLPAVARVRPFAFRGQP